MKLPLIAVALIVLLQQALSQTQAPPRGRIEGVVIQNSTPPQAVSGAKITVTKVNPSTGGSVNIPGRVQGTSITDGGNIPFPGMPAAGARGAAPAPPPPPPPPPGSTGLPIPPVITDRDGRFAVPDLEEGSYRVLITQSGYVRQEYGQRVFPGQGTLINLAPGQVVKDLVVSLTPTGNLGGRIFDNNGQPAVGVPLQLLKGIYNQSGERIFQNAGNARTNDRGEYRFFWVTPGRYYLAGGSSSATVGFFGANSSPNEPGDSYALTYYPGVADISRAAAIDVKPASELGADFTVPKQQLYTISGRVIDPNPVANADLIRTPVTISLAFQTLTGQSGTFTMGQAYNPATGTFELRDIVPGSYILQAAAPPATARLPVEVTNANVEGLVVTVDSGVTINGRFIAEAGDLPAPNNLRVQMRLVVNGSTNVVGFRPAGQASGPDGTFSIASVLPGQYRVIPPTSTDFYVKELRYDRSDALNDFIEVSRRNADAATMEILISRNVGEIDGVVNDERMQPVAGVQAVLIPERYRNRTELYKTATTDQTGRFVMRGVVPGDYRMFAWESMENFGYFDPDVMARSEALGTPVRVTESSKLSVSMKVIPANP